MRALLLTGLFLLYTNSLAAKVLHGFEKEAKNLFGLVDGVGVATSVATERGSSVRETVGLFHRGKVNEDAVVGPGVGPQVTNVTIFNSFERSLTPTANTNSNDPPTVLTPSGKIGNGGLADSANTNETPTGLGKGSGGGLPLLSNNKNEGAPASAFESAGSLASMPVLGPNVSAMLENLNSSFDSIIDKYSGMNSLSGSDTGVKEFRENRKNYVLRPEFQAPSSISATSPAQMRPPLALASAQTQRQSPIFPSDQPTLIAAAPASPEQTAMFPVTPTPRGDGQTKATDVAKKDSAHTGSTAPAPKVAAATTSTPVSGSSGGNRAGVNPSGGGLNDRDLNQKSGSIPAPSAPISCASACAKLESLHISARIDKNSTGLRKYILSAAKTPAGPYKSAQTRISEAHSLLKSCSNQANHFGVISGLSNQTFSVEIRDSVGCGYSLSKLEQVQPEGSLAPHISLLPGHGGSGKIVDNPVTVEPAAPLMGPPAPAPDEEGM